jgi:hypothetical protein
MLVMRRVMNWAIQIATMITSTTITSVDSVSAPAVWARLLRMSPPRASRFCWNSLSVSVMASEESAPWTSCASTPKS